MIHKVVRSGNQVFFIPAVLWGGLFGEYHYNKTLCIERDIITGKVAVWRHFYNPALDH